MTTDDAIIAIRYTALARTFGAKHFPKGSLERAKLNEQTLTSEYMTSYRYLVVDREERNRPVRSFRTRREAASFADALNAKLGTSNR
jgi:hypothetical protein